MGRSKYPARWKLDAPKIELKTIPCRDMIGRQVEACKSKEKEKQAIPRTSNGVEKRRGVGMSLRVKAVVDKFVEELKEAFDADRVTKEREMESYIEELERQVAERDAALKADLSRREAEIARQEARLKMEKENLEKERSVLMGTASNQDNQDIAL